MNGVGSTPFAPKRKSSTPSWSERSTFPTRTYNCSFATSAKLAGVASETVNPGHVTQRLAGRVCVIAGAASVIGEAVAERFAQEGGIVVGIDRVEHNVGVHSVRADLTDEDAIDAMLDEVATRFGQID